MPPPRWGRAWAQQPPWPRLRRNRIWRQRRLSSPAPLTNGSPTRRSGVESTVLLTMSSPLRPRNPVATLVVVAVASPAHAIARRSEDRPPGGAEPRGREARSHGEQEARPNPYSTGFQGAFAQSSQAPTPPLASAPGRLRQLPPHRAWAAATCADAAPGRTSEARNTLPLAPRNSSAARIPRRRSARPCCPSWIVRAPNPPAQPPDQELQDRTTSVLPLDRTRLLLRTSSRSSSPTCGPRSLRPSSTSH